MNVIPLTRANFEEHKKRIMNLIENIEIDDLDSGFEMNMQNGIMMGNHANECDSCNILHYLMAQIITKHSLEIRK